MGIERANVLAGTLRCRQGLSMFPVEDYPVAPRRDRPGGFFIPGFLGIPQAGVNYSKPHAYQD
jgi:hypothetical protein